jgi:FixJ family two-component response regulator
MDREETIAVIDDDAAVCQGTRGLLRSLGYSAVGFASAEEFLDSGSVNKFSCVITDMRMPGMSGIELQEALIAKGHRVPIIFMTAYAEEKTKAHAMSAGATGLLTKPFAEKTLVECLNSALQEG